MTDIKPEQPNNWGRWGAEDQRGAANLITGDVVQQSLKSVRSGTILSLSLPIQGATASRKRENIPHLAGRPLPQHFMSIDGADYAAGASHPAGGRAIADDALMISPHGTTTHIDALCHMWLGDKIYNGHPSSRIRSYGATRCGIENLGPMVTRGVFFDIAGLHNKPHLDKDYRISIADLTAVLAKNQLTLQSGDAVIIRTGWPTVFSTDKNIYWSGEPGLSSEAAEWLAAKDVAVVACDNSAISGLNCCGGADETPTDDIHMIFLWRHGIYLVEMLWLEELAKHQVASFLFILAPLQIVGGTGSPVNPIAVL